ncbi:MAG TPA: (Fe-S)-binding protein [Candidatus Sumerlaeota bacterium]|nr:(Fe-S)-binding protein [Candidatus Sumerlaeota bacterium]
MSEMTIQLPDLNCGLCGFKTCAELGQRLKTQPDFIKRCIHLAKEKMSGQTVNVPVVTPARPVPIQSLVPPAASCGAACGSACCTSEPLTAGETKFKDSLGRDFDFYLEHFPEDPGPREVIIPHNPMITRELDIQKGDILIGRPLGMSCGCPITHCGIVREVDQRTGVLTWCVTGPLGPRAQGYKDLGYYIAEAYEGLVTETDSELKIGARYFFQPRMCMLQWRHSGLINYLNRVPEGWQIRIEGLFIG